MTARTMALRLDRAQRRTERRDTLLGLLARLDTLTSAEQALLVEYTYAELAASDELRRTVQGQQRALQAAMDRTQAAGDTIVEVEQDRDFWKELGQGARDAELRRTAERDAAKSAVFRVRAFAADIDTPTWRAPGSEVAARIRLALDEYQEQPHRHLPGERMVSTCPTCITATTKEN
ncbi:hypothetical protein [Streptomyces sp. NPDC056169]|uniref:hypothetical protein n=1 Tax=Streptomyces sp. NPDC056169 TaxID=3345734 RepID=UPI0035E150C5